MEAETEDMDTNDKLDESGVADGVGGVVCTSTQWSDAAGHNTIGDSQFRMTQESTPSQFPPSQPQEPSKAAKGHVPTNQKRVFGNKPRSENGHFAFCRKENLLKKSGLNRECFWDFSDILLFPNLIPI